MVAQSDEHFVPNQSCQVKVVNGGPECESLKPLNDSIEWLTAYFKSGSGVSKLALPNMCHLQKSIAKGSFRMKVWHTLAYQVGFGMKVTYKDLAILSGSSGEASRAVGQAMRNNPVMLIVPCHRVILSSGSIGNYSAGTKNSVKMWLLDYEGSSA